MPMRWIPAAVIAALALLAPLTLRGEGLRLSGILGQSQPPGTEPLPSAGMRGVVCDAGDGLWSFADGTWWLSCPQGILGYDARLRPLGVRVGGLSGPGLLAVWPDGLLEPWVFVSDTKGKRILHLRITAEKR
ncbi:MAG: hypothetical protein A3K19_10775 [Lentisphaerae bacterium RIFOXYB12_FULL_65_16]|nr:MAG: hypothetical protein A3K18_28500 [Lentisphaerae bacterium RIFOXYA12_64_32]OGV87870.1 MAG: hypothetical protein A3K19_10775 [Lentisphaerae bacterium RIFOXYB12_FULL_65_16]